MEQRFCVWCHKLLGPAPLSKKGGQKKLYCSSLCRQAAFRAKKEAMQQAEQHLPGARTHWFDRQIAIDVLRYRFERGKEIIRIATGFFTVKGYNLLRVSARNKRMLILVGLDDPGEKRVRKALIQEIMLDLRTGVDRDRRQAVLELVERLKGKQFFIMDARAMQHHAKLYIVDEAVVIHGSSNMTGRGLIEAIESGDVIEDQQKVTDFVKDYDRYFSDPRCVNISQELIDELLKWLQMAQPWDVYLKTLDKVKGLADTTLQRVSYRKPVGYQNVVIARALRQIEETRGAMVVASTGLGKTIIGTDIALRLHEQGEILNVMVIGPKVVGKEWKARLASAGLSCDFFIHQALDVNEKQGWGDEFVAKLEQMDTLWLIIIDESHELRNRYKKDFSGKNVEERKAFQRLVPAIEKSQCKVLLLTGTPYSTDVDNINNQLYLLPHTAPSHVLPTFEEYYGAQKAWSIQKLSQLRDSPVGSVITTPHVAKYYGISEGNDIAIDFHGIHRYVPHVFLYRVDIIPPLEQEIVSALDQGYFRVDAPHWHWKIRTCIEKILRVAWGSSLWALREVIANVLHVGREIYHVNFVSSLEERQSVLKPILDHIDQMTYTEDRKLQWLAGELERLCARGNKVIVFSEQLVTVVYLNQALTTLLPEIQVACTVRTSQHPAKRGPQHKTSRTISSLLANFDPSSTPMIEDQKYQILLTTDAFGVGVNLQTAQTVINYDLAWTPIEPTQRAGRVLRLFSLPRNVQLYTLFPKKSGHVSYGGVAEGLIRRSTKLTERHEDSTSILELPTLATEQEHDLDMLTLASGASIISYGEVHIEEVETLKVSSIFEHVAVLEPYKKEVQLILDDIISAKLYPGKKPLMYVLLQYNGKYYWPLYDIKRQRLLPAHVDISVILDYIESSKDTPLALVETDEVEHWSDACIHAWCRSQEIVLDQVVRICAMYLKPQSEPDTVKQWFDSLDEQGAQPTSPHT